MRIKSFSILSVLLFFFSCTGFGQIDTTWIHIYGGDRDDKANDIIHTQDSGYLVIGSTSSFGFDNSQMYFLKLDSTGAIMWSKSHGGTNQEAGHSVIQTQDGGYLGVGYTNSWGAGGFDLLMVKLDASGNTVFEKYFGGTDWDFAWDVIETQANVFVMAGETQSFGAGGKDAWIVRYNANTDVFDWNKTIGGAGVDDFKSITPDPTGGFYAAGRGVQVQHTDEDVRVTRFDVNGDTIWNRFYGDTLQDYANDIIYKSNNELSLTGLGTDHDSTEYILIKNVDTLGFETDSDKWGIINDIISSYGVEIMEIDSQRISVLGNFIYGPDNSEYVFGYSYPNLLYNQKGATLGSEDNDVATSAIYNEGGGYSLIGYSNGFNSFYYNILMYKTNSDGVTDNISDYTSYLDTSNVLNIKETDFQCLKHFNLEYFCGYKTDCLLDQMEFSLYNQMGILIHKHLLRNNTSFNIYDLDIANGLYFMKFENMKSNMIITISLNR